MALPILATADDVRGIIAYLKNKPTGATISEAKAAVKKQSLDHRKLSAYKFWDITAKDTDRLKLSKRGWEIARGTKSEPSVFLDIVNSVSAYRSVLEWAFHQNLPVLNTVDVASHWHEHHRDACGTGADATLTAQAVSFFHVTQAAGLGKLYIGRRGQQTRLELNRDALQEFIESGPSAPPWVKPEIETEEETENVDTQPEGSKLPEEPAVPTPQMLSKQFQVFISHGKNMEIVDQVQTMLEMADIRGEVAEAEETTAIPVPEKVFNAMRRCKAGIIVVNVEESSKDAKGSYSINDNVLIEIGAAFVLYDRKVVLVWDKRLPIPSNLQGLYRCEYEGNELTWSAGMKLMKAIKEFRK
jgi:predicted nucleotide-binding protein